MRIRPLGLTKFNIIMGCMVFWTHCSSGHGDFAFGAIFWGDNSLRIALLEDDLELSKLITLWLEAEGHTVWSTPSGKAFIKALNRETFDLLILDWIIPDLSGEEVLMWVRKHLDWPIPVIFTTNKVREEDIVHALKMGADDYMTKPLRHAELVARINALGRRGVHQPAEPAVQDFGVFRIDRTTHSISRGGEPLELTQKEYDLAVFLFNNAGRLLSRGHILENVWGHTVQLNTRTLDTHVSRIRQKLALGESNGWVLNSIYQHGYRLERFGSDNAA